jgi:hypothetical protein
VLDAGVVAATLTRIVNNAEVVRLERGLHQSDGAELEASPTRRRVRL